MTMETRSFPGFSAEALTFLRELAVHNDHAWFEAHKDVYKDTLQAPMRQLVADLGPDLRVIDPIFDVNPRGGAVCRIRRDTRFSRDKAPYRTHLWITFKRQGRDWPTQPAFFMELRPEGYRYGMGYYVATPATMAALRRRIAARPQRFLEAADEARCAGLILEGECYKRPRSAEGQPATIRDWFQRKNACVVCHRPIDQEFLSPALTELLRRAFPAAAALYHFLLGDGTERDDDA